jgi:hypothetical protein
VNATITKPKAQSLRSVFPHHELDDDEGGDDGAEKGVMRFIKHLVVGPVDLHRKRQQARPDRGESPCLGRTVVEPDQPGQKERRAADVPDDRADLRSLLEARHVEHERLKKAAHIVPQVFFREVAEGRGGEKKPHHIVSFAKAWKSACRAAGCPGRIPHDLRRTAIRNFVRSGTSENVAMRLSGHQTRSVFDRYDIVSGEDLREAARKLNIAAGR